MDLGPQWPFWPQLGVAAIGSLLLAWLAVRHARRSREWRHGLAGLVLLTAVVCVTWVLEPHCHVGWRLGVEIPGCNWEYRPAPSEPTRLALFIVLGSFAQLLRLGSLTTWIAFVVAWGLLRFRPAAEPGVAADTEPKL
jgi:hypothetical protein